MRTTSDVAAVLGTTTRRSGVVLDSVSIDSREVRPGGLFVPLHGTRDGHEFLPAAIAAGASAYLTERPPLDDGGIEVADTLDAMTRLAAHARRSIDGVVVGVTGSVGKTTTKDMLAAMLAVDRPTYASRRSHNNHIGVPLTILNAPPGVRSLVLEIGANAPGEIRDLCNVAAPTIGVVTVVAPAHTEGFGGIEGVARAKAELVEALPGHGTAVLNADDALVAPMAALTGARVVFFGSGAGADVRVTLCDLDDQLRPVVRIESPWGAFEVRLAARGAHQTVNAAAAVAAAGVVGIDLASAIDCLGAVEHSAHRMSVSTTPSGATLIDDSYNANPASMRAALGALAAVPADRRIAVLGEMAELGSTSAAEHARIAELAAELGIEVVAVAAPAYGVESFSDVDAVRPHLGPLGPGDAVLVKGSRVAGLERLVGALQSP